MKIAVLRALQLGDLLVAVPALRALRRAYPGARIALVALPWARTFVERFSRYVDELVEYPGMPADYDLVLQMHGDGSCTNAVALALGGKRTAGFYRPGNDCPDRELFVEWDDRENEVLRCLRLTERVGARMLSPELEFPLTPADLAEWARLRLSNYVVVHAGSQLPSRRWPAERFATVVDWLTARGLKVVLTGTPGEPVVSPTALNLIGKTSLGGLAALVARAQLVVCNDTSVSHIAAAMRTPSVVVACGSDPRRWAPLDRQLHRVLWQDLECRPCMNVECPIGHPCALAITPGAVIGEASRMLACAA